ncbi:chlorophyllase/cutinase-like alpha/beta fold protein [Rhodococcus daqingensis]|uniref:PET hydrolase/cutinase-like domain-containing protein n=1 Tax=Rhodococcus daqingensis TaxID=2479363 RepID=A0ABW2RV99_9NOCA
MAPTPKTLASQLSKRGPHQVLRGDLSLAGQPGVVYTPAEGFSLPVVAFAHGWMTGVDRYAQTLTHLASWGLVVAAPDTQRTPVPSHLGLAADLRTAVDICAGVRLGPGKISVDPTRVAYAGHGMGAGAAVIAAAQHGPAAAVAALFPAPTAPSAERSAAAVAGPGLIVAGGEDIDSLNCNARSIAEAWGGQAILRTVDGASGSGLTEGRRLFGALGLGGSERGTQKTTRALLTGYLLYHLLGETRYEEYALPGAHIPGTLAVELASDQTSQLTG